MCMWTELKFHERKTPIININELEYELPTFYITSHTSETVDNFEPIPFTVLSKWESNCKQNACVYDAVNVHEVDIIFIMAAAE